VAKNSRDIYLVFEYMETDLYHAVYEDILEDIHKKYVLYQMLVGVKYLHDMGLIHRDLKPSNVLLDANCAVKICDFGMARLLRQMETGKDNVMTEGVATRWYRAP
jgi:mitogen-activated protein kinase 15